MAGSRHREEVINVKLADALGARGLNADAETIQLKGRPDVLVEVGGLKLVIEGRHEKETKSLKADARERVRKGLGDISAALAYPDQLYTTRSPVLTAEIEKCSYSGSIFFYAGAKINETSFAGSTIDEIAEIVRNVFGLIVQDDVVAQQVDNVETAIGEVVDIARTTNLFFKSEIVKKRLRAALAIEE